MKIIIFILFCIWLTGCAGTFNTAVQNLPSVKDCQSVSYVRNGNQITINAKCQIPLAESPLLNVSP